MSAKRETDDSVATLTPDPRAPITIHMPAPIMTLRDYFAAKAMQTLLMEGERIRLWAQLSADGDCGPKIASLSYELADLMLTERSK